MVTSPNNSMWVRTSLLQMVLPSGNTIFTTACLKDLVCLLGTRQISCQEWTETVRPLWDLEEEVVELYFHVGHDHVLRDSGEGYSEGGDVPCVPGYVLVLVLFLQGVGRRKVVGEKRERKTEEEVLTQFVVERLEDLQEIFPDRYTLVLVLRMVVEMKSGFMEDLCLSNLSSSLIPDPHGVVSCIKSGKKLVWKMGNSLSLPTSKAKMAITAHLPGEEKMIVLSQLLKQTLAKSSDTVAGADVSLHRARCSYIYLTTWLNSIHINKCTSSTIFTGPVRNTVKISGCRNLTIVTMARRIFIQECLDCTFYLFTPTR